MGTPEGKAVGSFNYVLCIDCETTGLSFNSDDPSEDHQAVSWGIIVANADTLLPEEELYIEVKWNEHSKQMKLEDVNFGKEAEEIHGLTFDYLEQNGVTEEEASIQIASLILKYWGPSVSVKTLGHNVHMFDMPFLRAMFRRVGIDVQFGARHYDTNSMGFAAFGVFNSSDLFKLVGYNDRGKHNALEDARMALGSARAIRLIVNTTMEE